MSQPPALSPIPLQREERRENSPALSPPDLRDIGDHDALRQRIYDQSLSAVKRWDDVNYGGVTLRLKNPHYSGPEKFNLAEQKRALLERGTLGRKLRGTWQLLDNTTGELIDEKKTTLASIPYLTPRGTFIHNGSEYGMSSQFRLRPGIFTRRKSDGTVETHINTKPGQGPAHRFFLDPSKGVFFTSVGQAKIPLLPLLRRLGVTDRQLRDAWGEDITAANLPNDQPHLARKYYERFLRKEDFSGDETELKDRLAAKFAAMELDPEVTRRTLGQPVDRMSPDVILDITKKLLAVSRNEADVDDRDNLAYQSVFGPEDVISERLANDYGGLRRRLAWRASRDRDLRGAIPSYLSKQVEAALLRSGLSSSLEEVNALELLDKQFRITRMGEGGIGSDDAIPEESRSVHDSQLAFVDGVRTPESARAGVDLFLANSVKKGADGKIYAPFLDARTGETVYRSPQETADLAIALPGEMAKSGDWVWAIDRGRLRQTPKNRVALALPQFENAFSPLANLIPFKSASKGQRMAMGARMLTQALALGRPEAPLVQSGIPGEKDRSYEQKYGAHVGAIRARQPARVMNVAPDGIRLRYADGREEDIELAVNLPFNRKSNLHQTPMVQPGQFVDAGTLLAKSNYTNDDGQVALGLNARVAFLPDSYNFEDAISISESFAKKLSAENMYPLRLDADETHKLGRANYVGLFPSKFNQQQLQSIDETGLVKPGTVVNYGDPLMLATRLQAQAPGRLHRKGSSLAADAAMTWDHHAPGVVTDAVRTDKGMTVLVKSIIPAQLADKISGRYGNKGVIGKIWPDHLMPHDKDGQPVEVLLNPLGVISRANPSQVIEMALGKIAARTGQPYRVADFENIEDLTQFAQDELKKHGLSDTEDLIDPRTGRKIKNVLTGVQYLLRLHHLSEDKSQGRGTGGYSAEDTPSRGGAGGAKRLSLLESNAVLAHGSLGVLKDAKLSRGQRNEDFWLRFVSGHTPPPAEVPTVYKKFISQLQASGINVVSAGTGLQLMAMTDKDVDELAGGRELQNVETLDANKLTGIPGGLFDPQVFGDGTKWGSLPLSSPTLNPVFEDPARRLLGLTQKQFEDVIAGREELPRFGGKGPQAIADALRSLKLPREIGLARQEIAKRRGAGRDAAVRRLGYLLSAQRVGVHPGDWMLSRVPVLPPVFRPISQLSGSKVPIVNDANYLYRELWEADQNLRQLQTDLDDVGEEQLAVYNALKAVTGLGDPLSQKLREKRVRGLLGHVLGRNPKVGAIQRRLLSSTVDLVGRGVIAPDPDLDMDSIGLPEDQAWDIYANFVARRLVRRGMPLSVALRNVRERSQIAKQEMLAEMGERPVIVSRAPVLHRYGIMAFWPKLTKSHAVKMSPLVYKGMGADNDGDAVNYHVPVSDEAAGQATEKMLPSRNLISPADFKTPLYAPSQEYTGGLYTATRPPTDNRRPHRFISRQAVLQALARGDIAYDDVVEIPPN